MLSKNNYKEKLRKMEQKTERFSIRKLSVGAASVLIGLSFFGLNNNTAKADTISENDTATETNKNVTTAKDTVNNKETSATGLNFTDAKVESTNADKNAANTNKDVATETSSVDSSKVTDTAKVTTKAAQASTQATSKQTHSNGTGGYTQDGINVPVPTEPIASQFQDELNKQIQPMLDEDLAKLGLDANTYYESATNHTKWHAIGWLNLTDQDGNVVGSLGTFLYHNPDGTLGVLSGEDDQWLTAAVAQAFNDVNNASNNLNFSQVAYLVPIVSSTSTIYVNKGQALTYEDIKRALSSNTESITGLSSGEWVNDEAAEGVPVVDVNKAGLQEGAARLTYVNGTKTSASISVDVVDLEGKTTYVNVNDPLPDASTVITGQPDGSTSIWGIKPDLSKAGEATGTVEVTYPDGSKGTANVTINVEDPQGKDITIHEGQSVGPQDVVIPRTYPVGSTITWEDGKAPNVNSVGQQEVSVIVTYPNGVSSKGIPATITVVAPEPKPIDTPQGVVPDPSTGIKNPGDMPTGTTYTWTNGDPDVSTPGTHDVSITVHYPDGTTGEVVTTITVTADTPTTPVTPSQPTDSDIYNPIGQDITTNEGQVPDASNGIANKDDLPSGTTYTWQNPDQVSNDVQNPGTHPEIIVVTYPDNSTDTVTINVIVEPNDSNSNPHAGDVDNGNGGNHGNGGNGSGNTNSGVHAGDLGNGNGNNHAKFFGNGNTNVNASAKTLPQTGSQDDNMYSLIGLMFASLGSIVALAGTRKRRN